MSAPRRVRGYVGARLIALSYLAIGLALVFQSGRFSNTPSYANLIAVMSSRTWGVLYLLSAAGIGSWLLWHWSRAWGYIVHTATTALTAAWLAAFVVRYFTDTGTTIVNVVSWSVFLTLTIRSALSVDAEIATRR